MAWTQLQIDKMVDDHYRGREVRCPAPCNAVIDALETPTLGHQTVPVDLHCPRCGQRAGHRPVAALSGWTVAQSKRIEDQYWANNYADCPNDATPLDIDRSDVIGEATPRIEAACKRCGRRHNF